MRKNKKSQVTIYMAYMFTAIFIVLIAAFFAPMGVRFNSEMYVIGEEILLDANDTISQIHNDTARTQIQATVNNAMLAAEDNIEINANLFQYSWILIIGLTALVIFLFSRRIVEYGQGGRLV